MKRSARLRLGLIGFSTRALAQAVSDLGHEILAADYFGDQDLRDLGEVILVDGWPLDLSVLATEKVDAWLLSGGTENCSRELDRLRARAPILGPSSSEFAQLRSRTFWESLCDERVRWPETSHAPPTVAKNAWLVKSMQSSGGLMVGDANDVELSGWSEAYWQRRLEGRTLGITWIFHAHGCELLGVTQALSAADWPGPTNFIYRGSYGPIDVGPDHTQSLQRFGQRLAKALPEYRGYLQADMIEDTANQLWLLEINPRWTSSMEILHDAAKELAASPLARHLGAWGIPVCPKPFKKPEFSVFSKAIYYAPDTIELSKSARGKLYKLRKWQASEKLSGQWCLADLPDTNEPGLTQFERGQPILTVKCRGGIRLVSPEFLSDLVGSPSL